MSRKFKVVLILIISLVLLVIVSFSPLWLWLQGWGQSALLPFGQAGMKIGTWLERYRHIPELLTENEQLKHQVAELSARQSTVEALLKENEELRRLVNLPKTQSYESLAVEVIGQQVDEAGITYLINRGQLDGLSAGLAVVAGQPEANTSSAGLVLVGTIKQVSAHLSSVALVTSNSSKVLAKLAQGNTGQSIAVGEYNLAVRLKYIELDELIKVGDGVVTSNLNRLIPAGLLIGTVTSVEKNEGELFQSAVVAPPIPPEQFRFLYVLKPLMNQ